MRRSGLIEIERIRILHQKLASSHQAEARTDLVTEFPLNVIEIERQVLVGLYISTKDLGDHLLVRWPVQHVPLVPVLDAQHFLAVSVVASTLTPEISRLDRGHQQFDGASAVLLLAHDLQIFCKTRTPSGRKA